MGRRGKRKRKRKAGWQEKERERSGVGRRRLTGCKRWLGRGEGELGCWAERGLGGLFFSLLYLNPFQTFET
jgi:hypothetical protein